MFTLNLCIMVTPWSKYKYVFLPKIDKEWGKRFHWISLKFMTFIYKIFTFKLRIDQWPNFPLMIRNVNFNNEPIIKPSELYSNTVSWIRRGLWVPESFVCCNGTLPGGNLLSRQSAATAWINHSIQLQLVLFDLLWPK